MSTHQLGRKFTCYSCHTKFYDLSRPAPICPKCGADQRDAEGTPAVTSHRGRRQVEPPPPVEVDLTEVEDEELGPEESGPEEEELVSETEEVAPTEEEEDEDEEEGEES